jgi:23S rRNA (pseudouridine1915-N3)-methyltransferase
VKIKVIAVGKKSRESWIEAGIAEYSKRLKPYLEVEFVWVKNNEQLIKALEKESSLFCLDPAGKTFTSEGFSRFVCKKFERGGARLAIGIGGPTGLPEVIRKKTELISLSTMTYTHQLVRVVLLEQIYRAIEISKGSSYHK